MYDHSLYPSPQTPLSTHLFPSSSCILYCVKVLEPRPLMKRRRAAALHLTSDVQDPKQVGLLGISNITSMYTHYIVQISLRHPHPHNPIILSIYRVNCAPLAFIHWQAL